MKLILLAATAMLAVPAFAQMTPAPAGTTTGTPPAAATPTTADPAQTADPAAPPAPVPPAPAPTAPAPSTDGGTGMTPPPAPADGTTPMGGYQPAGAPITGTVTPGVTPTFQAAPSPSEAYPAPAPLAKYPVCKKGQFDKCIQRGGK